ncbi:oxygen-independent coproporphyrinogen-3 oxidase [Pseudomonas sp. NFACC23-1]|uniref:radical SAM protein n=1 Tax=unclassified Pseudomonas TaxID=196821 RepID=UPI00087EF8C0|nr:MULTISPECIES: radical SAM protein [unclassified Pseudomonas]SDB66389.1 oxygen-independent coproporphyrinogen-3 oxidase [Pseudomonas sp. NFACC17-2]SEJ97315.1 oxygen-independent coproporphyrinogen-3 oxidase [Pseudomonas sp. NFACC23-1]SFW92984.1 oxygen-independent coproporphyrinogen-3 oxidase [Pseudomonas sp. NFACC16-2]
MDLISSDLLPFDMQYPVYNFFFPGSGAVVDEKKIAELMTGANITARKRALYLHIPFCDTICSFCPFTRGRVSDPNVIELYVQALINEIETKSQYLRLSDVPINAVFFGGGTPSMLSADQIMRIGTVLHRNFDLTKVKEFSFEIEVKSLTSEKVRAMRSIGVTHPRFGLQTFSKKWRDLFTLTATLDQIKRSIDMLSENFPTVSFDILYGMSGHTEEELISDLRLACDTEVSNIDIYPIDNIMTQPALHRKLAMLKNVPTSATRKFAMNMLVDAYMRSRGYMPHNGHGYRKVGANSISPRVVYEGYKFEYHEHVYGYCDHDLIGFGVSAISSVYGAKIINTSLKSKYISAFIGESGSADTFQVLKHSSELDVLRPLALRLPYFGSVEKKRLPATLSPEVLTKINHLKRAALLAESETQYLLTKTGWYNYVNIMYYLLPTKEQESMDSFIAEQLADSIRDISESEVFFKGS